MTSPTTGPSSSRAGPGTTWSTPAWTNSGSTPCTPRPSTPTGRCMSPRPTLTPRTDFAAALVAGPVLLDGGLATQLEAQGASLSTALWSAQLLVDDPDAVVAAHEAFFAAGAQVATTASYQAPL